MKWIARLVCYCAATACSFAGQSEKAEGIKRLYVEPFATQTNSEKLREDLISELRKLHSITIVDQESSADEILGGGGEIWIKAYRSLNPRSGTSIANGTPLYSGYLSVELKDTKGETLWSDLVTPPAAAEDITKDLAKRIAKQVAEAVRKGEAPPRRNPLPQPRTVLKGAGATFPYPVYTKWFTNYRRENPNIGITYDAIGSEAGVRRLLEGGVDFAASDSPDAIHELDPDKEDRYLFFPSVVGAVVPIVNLPGVASDINFTPEALAGIYLGKITKWNDPILARANRSVHLPDLDIVVVHRADGSGTSYAWTDYLSKTSPQWKAQVGSSLAPNWPTGRSANGNAGVAMLVKELGGAIGYVEFIYALENHLSFGKVRNQAGEFVGADLGSIAAATSHSAQIKDDLKISITNAPGAGAYPIASFTWFVVPAKIDDDIKRNAIKSFLGWMLGPGQARAGALGYLELPKDVLSKEEGAIGRIK